MASSTFPDAFKIDEKKTEPWPAAATIYQTYDAEQILLPENASCVGVQTYLRMCKVPFDMQYCANAKFMSPGGRLTKLPFLRDGNHVVAEFQPIVKYVEERKLGLGQWLTQEDRDDMEAYVALVENVLTMAELYICFNDKTVYDLVTAPRIASGFAWPLGKWQSFVQRRQAQSLLRVYQWETRTMDDVVAEVHKCCVSLTFQLEAGKGPYFYSDKPCDLDAIVFGHLYSIMTTKLPTNVLAHTVKKFQSLMRFCYHIEEVFYKKEKQRTPTGVGH